MSVAELPGTHGTKVTANDLLQMQKVLNIADTETALILRGLRHLGVQIDIDVKELTMATEEIREDLEERERLLSALTIADRS